MKVKIIKTGEIVDVSEARAKYWIRCNFAKEVSQKEKTEKIDKTEVEKMAIKKEAVEKLAQKRR